jgi:hypothetical protein
MNQDAGPTCSNERRTPVDSHRQRQKTRHLGGFDWVGQASDTYIKRENIGSESRKQLPRVIASRQSVSTIRSGCINADTPLLRSQSQSLARFASHTGDVLPSPR